MRVGGLASGIDTDSLIRELMNAERIPLNKLEQNKTKTEWKRDAFRDVNRQISELKDSLRNFRLNSSLIMGKKVSSTLESAVTATGNASALEGSFRISVENLATNAMRVNNEFSSEDFENAIAHTITNNDGKIEFSTYDEDGNPNTHSIEINSDDSMEDIINKINRDEAPVRAFFDENNNTFILETTRTGNFNTADESEKGNEIEFGEDSFFGNIFIAGTESFNEIGGADAKFTYNGAEFTSRDNNYTMHGITFNFHNETKGESAVLQVSTDTDEIVDNITEFVDKYNALVGTLQSSQNEPVYRDYPPLTEEQMEEMTDRQIELWEEKAKSGLLKGERLISSSLTNMRSVMYSQIDNDGALTLLTEIGISTTESYLDGGILEVKEDKLREALEKDAESVHMLLINSGEGAERGLLNRLEDTLDNTIKNIEDQAGKGSFTNQQYRLGRDLDNIDNRIEAFERRLIKTEDRYWRQFNAMEQAISMMNNQSSMLMSFANPNM